MDTGTPIPKIPIPTAIWSTSPHYSCQQLELLYEFLENTQKQAPGLYPVMTFLSIVLSRHPLKFPNYTYMKYATILVGLILHEKRGSLKLILPWFPRLSPANIVLIHSGQPLKTQPALQRTLSASSESAEMLAVFQVIWKRWGSYTRNKLQSAHPELPQERPCILHMLISTINPAAYLQTFEYILKCK